MQWLPKHLRLPLCVRKNHSPYIERRKQVECIAAMPHASRRPGFTLIELVVVVLMTAILLTAIAGVLRSVLREARGRDSQLVVTEQLIALLRRDLTNARHFRWSSGQLGLRGPLALDSATQESALIDAEVHYQVRATAQGSLLERRQTLPGREGPWNQVDVREPVWLGVTQIILRTSYLDATAGDQPAPVIRGEGWGPLPPAYQLQLLGEGRELLLSESFVGAG